MDIATQELKTICDEIRNFGKDKVDALEKHYETNLENVKLRYLLTHLRNFREISKREIK
jgi:hypothetical protein